MIKQLLMVAEFHAKHGFPVSHDLQKLLDSNDAEIAIGLEIDAIGQNLVEMSKNVESGKFNGWFDNRLLRIHLMCEELGEMVLGLGKRDEAQVCDGLADLLYVVLGTAVTYGIPVEELFAEVQRSNMSKDKTNKQGRLSDPRLRNKGKNYQPPDIEKVLAASKDGVRAELIKVKTEVEQKIEELKQKAKEQSK